MTRVADRLDGTGHGKEKVFSSSAYLVENLRRLGSGDRRHLGYPRQLGRAGPARLGDPVGVEFQPGVAFARNRSTWTTLLNASVDELADILAIPDGVTTIVTFPVAYTKGTEFKAGDPTTGRTDHLFRSMGVHPRPCVRRRRHDLR